MTDSSSMLPATIGQSRRRIEGRDKVTGSTKYAEDLHLPGLLFGCLVTSIHAHARVLQVVSNAAVRIPGVVAILIGSDLRPVNAAGPDQPLARDRVFFVGQPIALVLAETEAAAADGALAVTVDYDTLPALLSPVEAMAEGASAVFDPFEHSSAEAGAHGATAAASTLPVASPNITSFQSFHRGDVTKALLESDAIVRCRYCVPSVQHAFLEPHAVVAQAEVDGGWTVWTSTQGIFLTRSEVATHLGVPESSLRIVPMNVGGGFGGKIRLLEPLACLASSHTRRPVRLELTRTQEFLLGRGGPGATIDLELGAHSDGLLAALRATVVFDNGACSGGPGPLGAFACQMLGGTYRIPNLELKGYDVATNKTPVAAYRAPGAPQTFFALESALDELSLRLRVDPIDLRIMNAMSDGDPMPDGSPWIKNGLLDCLNRARSYAAYLEPIAENEAVGVAAGGWGGGRQPAAAVCRVEPDGSVTVHVGSVDISGTDTGLAIVAAAAIGLAPEKVRIAHGDTLTAPVAGMAGGSKTMYTVGAAVMAAALDARGQLLAIAAERLEADVADLSIDEGTVVVNGVPARSCTFGELAGLGLQFGGKYAPIQGQARLASPEQAPMFTVHVARVSVDPDTGAYAIRRYWVIQDVGRAINPAEVEGQVHGGVLQGLGRAFGEELVYDDTGNLRTSSFLDYLIPSIDQSPSIEVDLIEMLSNAGPFGAKGVGEPPAIPPPAAVANALARATGNRLRELPFHSERARRSKELER